MPTYILLIIALLVLWFIRFALGNIINRIISSKIAVVRRVPPTKVLRAHLLGLTLAFAFSLIAVANIFIGTDTLFAGVPAYFLILLVLILFAGSIWGWPWLLVVGLGVLWIAGGDAEIALLTLTAEWYMWGYIYGAVLATLYNDLAYWHVLTFRRKDTRVAWAFHTDHRLNIIKSPKENEMTVHIAERDEPEGAMRVNVDDMTVEVDPGQRLYDYHIDTPPPHPYTIAFIANPWVLKYKGDPEEREDWEVDPIIRDRDLFLRMVDWALSSLEQDEVVGQPEIWSRVRIMVMFDGNLIERKDAHPKDYGMLQPYHEHPEFDGEIAENLIDPRSEIKKIYPQMVDEAVVTAEGHRVEAIDDHRSDYNKDIDVIFALSASPLYTRATAHFSDWDEDKEGDAYMPPPGTEDSSSLLDSYIYCPDPELISTCPRPEEEKPYKCSEDLKDKDAVHVKKCGEESFTCKHEHYSTIPGRVALNVIGANSRTYIHEFAHAMSSAFRGAIVDEYFDRLEAHSDEPTETPDRGPGPFMINRIERNPTPGKVVPIPKVFAEYNCTRFHSDPNHPSARETWVGYFPDRIDPNATCIMDRTYYYSRFDELLSNFIYDRLIAKINRG